MMIFFPIELRLMFLTCALCIVLNYLATLESYLGCDFPDERRALVRGKDGELVVVEEACVVLLVAVLRGVH